MDKRGQGLTLNTIIMAILVIIVLVVIVLFFLGTFGGVTDKIKSTFFSTTVGTSEALAVETCRQYCDQAQRLPKDLQEKSAYCKQAFIIDGKSGPGQNKKYDKAYKCGSQSKPNRNIINADSFGGNLGISCPQIKCKEVLVVI